MVKNGRKTEIKKPVIEISGLKFNMEPVIGLEPMTCSLRMSCSTD